MKSGSPFDAPTRVHNSNPFDAPTRVSETPEELLRSAAADQAVIATPIEPTNEGVMIGGVRIGGGDDEPKVIVPATSESGPNPFDDQVWRAEGGSDASADIAGAHPVISTNPLVASLAAFFANKRNLAIAAGGAVLLIVVIVMAMGGDSKPSAKAAKAAKTTKQSTATKVATGAPSADDTQAAKPAESPTAVAAAEPSPEPAAGSVETPTEVPAAVETGAADGNAKPDADAKPDTAAKPAAKPDADKAVKKPPTIGGKQVVLEYDTQAREGKPVPNAAKDEQAAISKARTAYTAGNSKLFAGDADGAIQYYRQALAHYPAYVASYRGLGLAYAQKGDNANATKALRTYVGAAPHAKDASLIRKRIQSLSAK